MGRSKLYKAPPPQFPAAGQGRDLTTVKRGSGSPGGMRECIRTTVGGDGEVIIAYLADLLQNTQASPKDRLEAARILLERGWGKTAETTVTVDGNRLAEQARMAPEDLTKLVQSLSAPAGAASGSAIEYMSPPSLPPPSTKDANVAFTLCRSCGEVIKEGDVCQCQPTS